jgi:hypothetical protein
MTILCLKYCLSVLTLWNKTQERRKNEKVKSTSTLFSGFIKRGINAT